MSNGELPPRDSTHESLSPREREVLEWIACGKSNAEIGTILGIAERTVGKHCENLYRKLGVENRTSAALLHIDQGGLQKPLEG